MKVKKLALDGMLLIEPRVFGDARGYFIETWAAGRYRDAGLPQSFVQDNLSHSKLGVLRGLHLQHPHGQGKLVSVQSGSVFDVAVDVRVGSPTFGRWVAEELSDENHRQLYVPPGFAHGFCVTSEHALFSYKCSDEYHPECELCIRYDDPALGIAWPKLALEVSAKDLAGARLADISEDRLPRF